MSNDYNVYDVNNDVYVRTVSMTLTLCVCVSLCVCPQIENANDVLIMPLERFRKEQISAAKVRR